MGRKRRCVGTQLDATAVKNHVRMRGTQGTQEIASVTSGHGASASHVEYIFADVPAEVQRMESGSWLLCVTRKFPSVPLSVVLLLWLDIIV